MQLIFSNNKKRKEAIIVFISTTSKSGKWHMQEAIEPTYMEADTTESNLLNVNQKLYSYKGGNELSCVILREQPNLIISKNINISSPVL